MKPFHAPYSILPESTGSQSLGKDDLRWLEAFLTNLNVSSRATVPTPINLTDAATKQYVDDRLAQLTVEEADGSPSLAVPTTIRLDQADGFVLTNPSSGVARIDLAAIPNSVLANSSVTVAAGGGLSGGGAIALGGSATLALTTHDHQGAGTQGGTLDAAAIATGLLAVARGGTGIGSGTSGGVLAFTAGGTLASSAALTLNGAVLGGGVGAAPSSTAAGAANEVLRVPSAGGAPAFGTIVTAGIADGAVTDAKLRNSAALTVMGRSVNSSGGPADIAATATSAAVLRESGSTIGFGTVATAGIADDAITDAKLRNAVATSVIGRSAATSGDPADIAAAADNDVLRRSAGVIGFGTIDAASLGTGTVATARLGAGTANSTTFLRGDQTWAAAGPTGFTVVNTTFSNAGGNVLVTGAGFTPKAVFILAANSVDSAQWSQGYGSSATARFLQQRRSSTAWVRSTTGIYRVGDGTDELQGDLVSLDSDGATFSRTVVGAGKAADVSVMFFR